METKIVAAIVMAVFILIISSTLLGMGFTALNQQSEDIQEKDKIAGDFLTTLGRLIILVSYPTTTVRCSAVGGEMNNYEVSVNGLKIKYKGETEPFMNVYPALYFKGQKVLDDRNQNIVLRPDEPGDFPQLTFNVESSDPPIIDRRGDLAYSDKLNLYQSLYLGSYKFQLRKLEMGIPKSVSEVGLCEAKISYECRDQYNTVSLFLREQDKLCEEQADQTTCSKKITDACNKTISVELVRYDKQAFYTCSNREPIFSIKVEPETYNEILEREDEEKQGIIMLGEDYIIGFWKADEQHRDCYQRNIFMLEEDCKNNFLGAYRLRVLPDNYPKTPGNMIVTQC